MPLALYGWHGDRGRIRFVRSHTVQTSREPTYFMAITKKEYKSNMLPAANIYIDD